MGGTLTPALLDERCLDVLSIDLRPNVQPDARHSLFDYSQSSTAKMMENLRTKPHLDLGKLTTFDGAARSYDFQSRKGHFTFIDAEHTDEAVFADFVATYDQMERNGVCGFHDSNLITAALENICSFLSYQKREFRFLVFKNSSVSAIFLDHAAKQIPAQFLTDSCPWEPYKLQSRDELLIHTFRSRCNIQFNLKERPIHCFKPHEQ